MSVTQTNGSGHSENDSPAAPTIRSIERGRYNPGFLTAEEWLTLPCDTAVPILGKVGNPIVRVFTKNIVQASEKAFKTTFMLRIALGIAAGQTVIHQLPVPQARSVLYCHGELSPPEIAERTQSALRGLQSPGESFHQGLSPDIHVVRVPGQSRLKEMVSEFRPEVVVLDPWQSFITGCDENGFEDTSEATAFLNSIIAEFGVTLFIVAHTGKDKKRGIRGHSMPGGWRDTLVSLNRKSDTVEIDVDPRWAPRVGQFTLRFSDGTLEPYRTCLRESAISARKLTNATQEVVDALRECGGRMSKGDLRRILNGPTNDALRKRLERAEESGAIRCKGQTIILPTDESEAA